MGGFVDRESALWAGLLTDRECIVGFVDRESALWAGLLTDIECIVGGFVDRERVHCWVC